MVDVEQVFELLSVDESLMENKNPKPLTEGTGEIEFKNVTFTYDDSDKPLSEKQTQLDNISFKVEQN